MIKKSIVWHLNMDIENVKKDKQLKLLDNGIKVYIKADSKMNNNANSAKKDGKTQKILFIKLKSRDKFIEQVTKYKLMSE